MPPTAQLTSITVDAEAGVTFTVDYDVVFWVDSISVELQLRNDSFDEPRTLATDSFPIATAEFDASESVEFDRGPIVDSLEQPLTDRDTLARGTFVVVLTFVNEDENASIGNETKVVSLNRGPPGAWVTDAQPSFDGSDHDKSSITPKLRQGSRSIEPMAVTRLGGTLPFNTETIELQGGETFTDSSGSESNRLVYEAVITKRQFDVLNDMRLTSSTLQLVSAAYTGPVTFDQLKFDRLPDANGAITRDAGQVDEPIYTVQLQTKESEESNDDVIFEAD